ncbi:MAG: hypothetical protein KA715_11875 [Xanthomonadaceae bacterium]|nr:hypothetical protein [Xanthomonadaceae bacterium]
MKTLLVMAVFAASSAMASGPCKNPNIKATIHFYKHPEYANSDTARVQEYTDGKYVKGDRSKDKLAKIAPTELLKKMRDFQERICANPKFNDAINSVAAEFKTKPYATFSVNLSENNPGFNPLVRFDGVLVSTGKMYISNHGQNYYPNQKNADKDYITEVEFTVKTAKEDIERLKSYKPEIDEKKNKELLEDYYRK